MTPAVSQAQHFSFSVGGGHHHGYHHHGCWHDCSPYWGPHWYGPSLGVIYAPPPVVRERVVYVQPQNTNSWAPANAAVTAAPSPAAAGDGAITIRNASGARLPVAFQVDGQDAELADGQVRTFAGLGLLSVQYDRGGRYGSTQQELTAGNYEFRITPTGWDLVRQPDVPTLSRTPIRANSLPSQR